MQILIAPNAFKNSLEADEVAFAIKEGLEQSNLKCNVTCFPVGDGGDGTGKLLLDHFRGQIIDCETLDPLGRKITSSFGLIDEGKTAVIEMANASGLRLLRADQLNPLRASTYGTGQLIVAALDKGVTKIILCIGGSATVDGGVGILQALGFQFLSDQRTPLADLPENLTQLHVIDFSKVDSRINDCKLVILCDVENVLLGAQGAATVFGPQKGADADAVTRLDASLTRLRDIVLQQTGKDISSLKRGGAAGGIAAGLAGLLNAELANGIDFFLSITNFDSALRNADLVITGEGSIDLQTLQGKGPFGVAKKAKEKGIPVIGLAGKVPLEAIEALNEYFDVISSISNEPMDLAVALTSTKENLTRTARSIGNLICLKKNEDSTWIIF
jgi:glycerate kinase